MNFLDGPAKDCGVRLNRAPIYLRMVRDRRTGAWDGLDKLDDFARTAEEIFAYKQVAYHGSGSWDGIDPKTRRRTGGRLHLCDYAVIEPQPDDATMRNNAAWRAWAQEQHEATTIVNRREREQ